LGYEHQEFPKWKYHRHKGSQVVQNADEEKALGWGWKDRPITPSNPSPIVTFLEKRLKPWWERWSWLAGPTNLLSTILIIIAWFISRFRH